MKVGIYGAGKLGITLARLSLAAGHQVFISSSSNDDTAALSVSVLAPGAKVTTHQEITTTADFIILALPLGKYKTIDPSPLKGKLVLDAMNYWPEVDGIHPEFDDSAITTTELVQQHLCKSRVVKAFSHMGYHDLADYGHESDVLMRRVVMFAGATPGDAKKLSDFIDSIGFEPVDLGALHEGRVLQPGNKLFGANLTKAQVTRILA